MCQKLLTDLPTEILITILYRLPPKTIISCKCICKTLFHLLESPDFVKFHLSKSTPGLIVYNYEVPSRCFKVFEFKELVDLKKHELHCVPVTELDFRAFANRRLGDLTLEGSSNGLLFFRDQSTRPQSLYICNPMTCEYINLPTPEYIPGDPGVVTFGFGVSKKTDQYKVVRIFRPTTRSLERQKSECLVYTLGTGSRRSVPFHNSLKYICHSTGEFLNGNLHWLVSDLKKSQFILCFDLENEQFKEFSFPHLPRECRHFLCEVGVLEDRLYSCYNTSDYEIVVWVMKEYGVEKSWTKGFVIREQFYPYGAGEWYEFYYPIKVFGDGDILLLQGRYNLNIYSNETKTIMNVDTLNVPTFRAVQGRLHVTSFLSLKSFALENVSKF